jgi:transposase
VQEEERDLPEADKCCPQCGEAFVPFPGSEDSDIIEIEVRPYIRRTKRKRYRKTCRCPQTPGIITAPPAPRLIPKSAIGVSIWTEVLSAKYLHAMPLNRIVAGFEQHGLPLAAGTLTDGMQRLAPLFEPLMEAFYEQQMTEKLFHSDETRWEVFEELEGKTGHRWFLWAIRSASVVIFRVSPTRSADTPKIHFAGTALEIVLVCDRYSAYKCLEGDRENILLAFCWAHVRRDFLDGARSYPELEARMFVWVEDIRELYRLNAARVQVWDAARPLTEQAAEFTAPHRALTGRLESMQSRCETDLNAEDLHSAERKVLQSLQNHREGLTRFVSRPEIPMDNNAAERTIRGPVTGRKNYYGSGSIWSAGLAAMLFSLFQTLLLWKLNPHHWLHAFLQACAENGGNTPSDLSPFLPWTMSDERREILSRPLPTDAEPTVPDTS